MQSVHGRRAVNLARGRCIWLSMSSGCEGFRGSPIMCLRKKIKMAANLILISLFGALQPDEQYLYTVSISIPTYGNRTHSTHTTQVVN